MTNLSTFYENLENSNFVQFSYDRNSAFKLVSSPLKAGLPAKIEFFFEIEIYVELRDFKEKKYLYNSHIFSLRKSQSNYFKLNF